MGTATRTTVELPRLTREAAILPKTLNDETRTVDVIWTTGSRVRRGYFQQYWEQLSLDPKAVRMKRLNNGAPLLNAHQDWDANDVIGLVEPGTAVLDSGKRGIATVRFAKAEDDPEADQIYRKVKDGIIQNISVGYQTYEMTKVSDGGADKIPIYEATDWEPYELSVVPCGADDGAGFRAAGTERHPCVFLNTRKQQERKPMDPTTEPETGTEAGGSPDAASAAVAATQAALTARNAHAKELAAAQKAAAQEAERKERARTVAIRNLADEAGIGQQWASDLIEAGCTIEQAREQLLHSMFKRDQETPPLDGHVRVAAGEDSRDKWMRCASAWLLERSGQREMLEDAKKKLPRAREFQGLDFETGYGEFNGLSPLDLARSCLERGGVRTKGIGKMDLIGRAFMHRSGNFQTTSDFGTLLENVLGKVLLGAYATQPNTFESFTKRDVVPDFRTSNRYRTGSIPGLDVILEHGEYKNGAIPDGAKYPLTTQRTGKIFALSREAIVNDDMGALTDLATQFGKAAMRTIENAVYALINANSGLGPTQGDGQPFFHANRSNVNATGAAISVDAIDLDAAALAQQKDPNGQDFLDLQPAVLLVHRQLRGTADVLNRAEYDTTVQKFQVPNKVRGLFRQVIGSPRLTDTKRRYLIADPLDWIVVAWLEGYAGPVLENQMGWRVDGVEWKVTVYAKAQMGDPKGALTNAGQ